MRTILICVTSLLVALAATAKVSPNGVEAEIAIFQLDRSADKNVVLYHDTTTFLQGVRASGFFAGFSFEVELEKCDTAGASFSVQIVTLKERAETYADHYRVEYGVPARKSGISGKNDASYTLSIMLLKPITIDTTTCSPLHYRKDDFYSNPSRISDVFYVPKTLGEFSWRVAKGLLEDRNEAFNSVIGFNMPGKTQVFLCPCRVHSFIWDTRFGTVTDPTRNTAAGIYNKWFSSADPFLLNEVAILRMYGYGPPFLSEGLANYLTIASYDLKQVRTAGKVMPLDSMLSTYTYYHSDPKLADRISASFVRYLVDAYSLSRFVELYRKADDLNLRSALEGAYGKSVSALEQEWLHYVDTVKFSEMDLLEHAEEAEALMDYPRMLKYSLDAVPMAASKRETTFVLNQAVLASFYNGDYYGATSYQKQVAARDSAAVASWIGLASYQTMNGYYDSSWISLQRAFALDSANQVVKFNLGLSRYYAGDLKGARNILEHAIADAKNNTLYEESRIMLSVILLTTRDTADRRAAIGYCTDATNSLRNRITDQNTNTLDLAWLGVGYVCLGDVANAEAYLQLADILESRPFYQGMIWLWMGKAADLRRERTLARQYYGQVLGIASAAYHQKEARALLDTPYRR